MTVHSPLLNNVPVGKGAVLVPNALGMVLGTYRVQSPGFPKIVYWVQQAGMFLVRSILDGSGWKWPGE